MNLLVQERLALLMLLPQHGNLTTIRIVRKLREELSFDETEHEALKFQQVGDQLQWEETGYQKDITIGAQGMGLIARVLLKLDKEEQIHEEHLSLYGKFEIVIENQEAPK